MSQRQPLGATYSTADPVSDTAHSLSPTHEEAVIYCRVSSERQAKEGDGARSQEQRCRSYAEAHGYRVVRVFVDDGVSGAITDRPGILAMLRYLSGQAKTIVVIIDDISRIARDVRAHGELRAAIRTAGGRLESPSLRFEESASGEFVEYILAAAAQYGRNGNKEQVLNRMRARLQQGYWTFPAPPGYRYEKHPVHKKWLVPSREARTILGPALDAYSRGRLLTLREVATHLKEQGFFHDRKTVGITVLEKRMARIMEMLALYAGLLEYEPWGIGRVKAQHEPIIAEATLSRIRERQANRAKPLAVPRADSSDLFLLRGFVRCEACGRPLTGSLAKGVHPRYNCYFQGCPAYGKSFSAREFVEPAFQSLLFQLTPKPEFLRQTHMMANEAWENRGGELEKERKKLERERSQANESMQTLVRRLALLTSDSLIPAIEREVAAQEKRVREIEGRLAGLGENAGDYQEAWERVNTYISYPAETWGVGSVSEKRIVQRIVFTRAPTYSKNGGLNTYDLSLPYLISERFKHTKASLVDLTGKSYHLIGAEPDWKEWFDTIIEWSQWVA